MLHQMAHDSVSYRQVGRFVSIAALALLALVAACGICVAAEKDEKKQTALDLDSFFETDKLRRFNYEGRSDFEPRNAFLPLAGIFYGDIKGFANRISRRPMPPDQMQLLLYASAPESFAMQGKGFHGEKGWVLYVIDLFHPTP